MINKSKIEESLLQMNNGKRSVIKKSRLKELQKPGAVYVITCGVDGCPCKGRDVGCGRGFFSLFIQVVYGIQFSQRIGIPYYVGFDNTIYSYTDPKGADSNFWNYYFIQPNMQILKDAVPVVNKFIEIYPLKIWSRGHFREVHANVVRGLLLTDGMKHLINEKINSFKNNRVLGVHMRGTDHFDEIPPVDFQRYLKTIDKLLPGFDKLFISTDDSNLLRRIRKRYNEKVIFNCVTRSDDQIGVHSKTSIEDRVKLGVDVILDCYCLANCDGSILNHSNVSYATLLINPELPYILLEHPKSKLKRLKTLFLYYLDKYGIRKW